MITEDIGLVKEIFSILDVGIIEGYDSFIFEVEVGDGYIDFELSVELNGSKTTNAKTNFNYPILYGLVKKLRANADQRGECWGSFVMSYSKGGQVHTNFKYA
ncbi:MULTISPECIES: hypothetical protein [Pseudomonas]|uniref:hypothetical protein n=1 Tax=Pseudomonas nitroreducens TaxID=46680 RepID=UPI001E330C1A|nr:MULTISPECIES: hypothetical protein [Pseudomonas]MCE4073329.1 hypothetical protein [Pseudomonas nitritireducens]MCE4079625.1 hypothetical protein [Pseudomonas nitroreducens]